MRKRFVRSVDARDADAPGYYDIELDMPALLREFAGDAMLDRLARKHGETRQGILRLHAPGAFQDPETGEVSLNAGYDDAHDEGQLEEAIWQLVMPEVQTALAPRPKRRS